MRYLLLLLLCGHVAFAAQELVPTDALIGEDSPVYNKKKGSSSSIGTDAIDVRVQSAWFYGNDPIVTCYQRLETFGIKDGEAVKSIERSLARWRDYFSKKKIAPKVTEQTPNLNFKFIGKCKGDENLVIHLGTGPIFGGLQDLKAVQRLNYPAAYINKTHMTRDLKWGKGYIRLVAANYYGNNFPDWSKASAMEAVLTHELGHVLGFVHTAGTIMDGELVDRVFDKPLKSIEIDQGKQLVSCLSCATSFRLSEADPGAALAFAPLGLPSSKAIKLLQTPSGFKISNGKKEIELKETSRSSMDSARVLLSNFATELNDRSEAFNIYAKTVAEPSVPVILEYNSGSALVLRAVQDGEIRTVGHFERD